jgi:hypothetical protein
MPGTQKAPGLNYRKRSDGSQAAYWVARRDLVKKGYRPKAVRLHYAVDDPAMVARCHVLQAEMLTWAVENRSGPVPYYDGTFESLVKFYESHPDSPYHDLRVSQRSYSKTMAALMKHKGSRRVDAVDGSDVRRWYKELCESHSKGWAYYTVNVLKCVLSFGAAKKIAECRDLRAALRETKFGAPPAGKERMTYEQMSAFCRAAELDRASWMARILRIQFELGLRRRDVIGEYRDRRWQDGLTWGHIDSEGVVRKLVSKTKFTSEMIAVHQIADYPELEAELARTPINNRIGPLVLMGNGLPPTDQQCRYHFRRIAQGCRHPG